MSTPIRIKRSSVAGKRPTADQLQVGELAFNFNDGHLYSKRDTEGVGIGTTAALLTPWKENFNGGSIYYENSVGIGSETPTTNLDVAGSVKISDTLTVPTITVTGAGNTFAELNVTGFSTFASDVDINASVDISSNLTVDGHTELDELNVAGVSTFASDLDINASVDISNNLNVTGVSTFASDLDVNASIDILNDLTVDGFSDLDELNVAGIATFASDLDINAAIDVDGHTELDELQVTGISTFTADLDINAAIDVDGHTELDELQVTGISTFTADLDINAAIDVDGHTELDELNVSGVSTFAGLADFNGGVDISGHVEIDNIIISGVTTFTDTTNNTLGDADTGAVQIDGGIGINKNATIVGSLEIGQDLNVTGISTFASDLDINASIDVDGLSDLDELNVAGIATFASDLDINASVDISNNLNVSGVSTFASDIDFNASLDISNNLTVDGLSDLDELNVAGIATFASDLDINASVDILTNLTVEELTDLDELNVAGISTFGSDVDVNASVDISNNLTVDGLSDLDELNVAGIATFASDLDINASVDISNELNVTGVATFASNVNISTGELHGPAEFIIDPAAVGDNTGLVRIKGDLYVDGTEFIVNSGTIQLADLKVGIATTVGSNALLDGAGIGIGSANVEKTFIYDNSSNTLQSSIGLGVTTGGDFKTGIDSVLNRTTLGPTVVNSSLTSVGTLGQLNVSGVTTATTLNSTNGTITNLSGTIGTITTLESTNGTITNLSGTIGTVTTLESTNGTITNLSSTNLSGTIGTITTLESTNGTITNLSSTNLSGTIGTITTLESTNGTITNLSGTIGTVTTLESTNGTITNLSSTNLSGTIGTVTTLDVGGTLNVTGVSTFQSNVYLGDNDILYFGNSNDFQIYHASSGTFISDEGFGDLNIRTNKLNITDTGNNLRAVFNTNSANGGVSLYYGFNDKKFETIGAGVTVTGTTFTNQLNVSGIITGTLDNTLTLATSGTGLSGSATYDNSGASTFTVTSNATDANTGGTIVARDGSGNFSAGTITADLSGNASTATYAPTAGVATALQTARDFSITGSFVTAPAISFDGTGNVALAATITADSITLGTYTSGDYVQSITGTTNQVTVTGGTGEGSTPVIGLPNDVTISNDLTVLGDVQINQNLNVTGNITIGGTSAILTAETLQVSDADIILGVRTDAFGNDISTDNTANHGGIAIASTEGSPLVDLTVVGIETFSSTYKKIMWFKSGTFTGLGTDAWLSNYAVGIGSTQFPSGTRLAAGQIQITENTISSPQLSISGVSTFTAKIDANGGINATGVVTATTFSGSGANLTNIPNGALTNSSVSYGGISLSLGGSDATPAFNLADATGLPVSTGISGLGANVATFLATPSSANLASAVTDETGSGALVFANSPTLVTPVLGQASAASIDSSGIITASSFVKSGGTSSEFLKADGSVDTNTYLTAEAQTLDGVLTFGNTSSSGMSVGVVTATSFVKTSGTSSQFLKADGSVDSSTYLTSALQNVVEDTTPQLGGNLDLNGKYITGTGNVNITGVVTATSFVKSGGTSSQFLKADGSVDSSTYLTSALQNVVEDTTPQLGGNLDLNSNNITGTGNVNITGVVTATSFVKSGGTSSQFLKADGSVDSSTYLTSALQNVVEDTTPQLGGNLDLNGKYITGTGGANITGVVTATTFSTGNFSGGSVSGSTGSFTSTLSVNTSSATGGTAISLQNGGDLTIYSPSNTHSATLYCDFSSQLNLSGAFVASGDVTATSFVKTSGTSSQFLKADGSVDSSTYLTSALQNVVEDTTPQLGGNLDLNSRIITGTGGVNITGIVTATTIASSTLKNYAETVTNLGTIASGTKNINLSNGNVFYGTLPTSGTVTFTFTTGLTAGAVSFTLYLKNGASGTPTLAWPAAVKFPGGSAPDRTTTANKTDIWTFSTYNNGTDWYGDIAMYNL